MLSWGYTSEAALKDTLRPVGLVPVRKGNDCHVKQQPYNSAIQLWVGNIASVQYVVSSSRLVDDLRQPRLLIPDHFQRAD